MIKWWTGNEGNRNEAGILLYGLIVQEGILQQAVSIGASATKIPTTPLSRRKSLWIFNNSSNVIYMGDSTVTTANGFPLYPHGVMNIQVEDGIDIYGISTVAAQEVRILEGR